MSGSQRVAPDSTRELCDAVADCDASGRKILVVGGDTLRGMGLPPERTDVVLDLSALGGVAEYEPSDLTIGVRAGMPLQAIENALAAQRQFLPFDAPHPERATAGGTLAAGWLGPRRHRYGRPRDYLIGSEAVLADGTLVRAGGMVVKNVAGYDLSRLYAGSFGTLAVYARLNFKTLAKPKRARAFLAPLPENTRARAVAALTGLAATPSAAFWIAGFGQTVDGEDGEEGRIFALLEGDDSLLERATRDLRSAIGRAGVPETRIADAGARESLQRTVDAYVDCLGERSVTFRLHQVASGAQEAALQAGDVARHCGLRCETIADLMNGDVVARVSDLDARAFGAKIEQFDDALHARRPDARVIAGDHPARARLRVWGADPPALEKMRALKARFDPNRTLNPGRFVGGI